MIYLQKTSIVKGSQGPLGDLFIGPLVVSGFGAVERSNLTLIISGWSNQYQGVALASTCDVIFVSINYRLGAFGRINISMYLYPKHFTFHILKLFRKAALCY